MDKDQIKILKRELSNCFPNIKDISPDVFDKEGFHRWPTDPLRDIDKNKDFMNPRDLDEGGISDFDDIEPNTQDELEKEKRSLKDTSRRIKKILQLRQCNPKVDMVL